MVAEQLQTILVRQSRWETTRHQRTIEHKNYSTEVVSNNGNSIYGWSTTINTTGGRHHSTTHSQHAPLQNATTSIHRRVWCLWRMEVQVSSIHGTNGQHSTTTAGECREFHNNHQRRRPSSSSIHNRGSKQVESWSHWLTIHSHQHMLRSSSNNLQATPVTEWFWDLPTIVR